MDNDFDYTDLGSEIGDEPPEFSIGNVIESFSKRGLINTINDEVIGPHAHLLFLLFIILIIGIIVGVIQIVMP